MYVQYSILASCSYACLDLSRRQPKISGWCQGLTECNAKHNYSWYCTKDTVLWPELNFTIWNHSDVIRSSLEIVWQENRQGKDEGKWLYTAVGQPYLQVVQEHGREIHAFQSQKYEEAAGELETKSLIMCSSVNDNTGCE